MAALTALAGGMVLLVPAGWAFQVPALALLGASPPPSQPDPSPSPSPRRTPLAGIGARARWGRPMTQRPAPADRDRAVVAVAAFSLAAGLACTLAPERVARLAGADAAAGTLRAVGVADLVIAGGLRFARRPWPWPLVRAATNPAIAGVCLATARSRRARVLAAGLVAATAADVRTAVRLRSAAG